MYIFNIQADPINTEPVIVVEVLLNISKDSVPRGKNSQATTPKPGPADSLGQMEVIFH